MGHKEHELGWPSVTQALSVVSKPFLYRWYATHGWDKCEQIKREAGDVGTRIHDAIERLLKGETVELSGHEHLMVEKFMEWKDQAGLAPVDLERKVQSTVYEYHGTLDAVVHFGNEGELYVYDWKSSSQIDDLYGAQLAAYANAYTEETGKEIKGGGVVRLDKKPGAKKLIEVKEFTNLPEYFETFKACLRIWNFLNKPKRKKAA